MTSSHPAAMPVKPVGPLHIQAFNEQGYVVVHGFLGPSDAARIAEGILAYAASARTTQVRWAASHFDTFNGTDVDSHFPALSALYAEQVLRQVVQLDARMATVSQRSVGISVNVIPANGKFQPHFDRHRFTAVLYLNDDYEGGDMQIFPRLRYWLGPPGHWIQRKAQRLLDRYVRRASYLHARGRPATIRPKAGDLLIFEGVRSYHAVTPVTRGAPRVSVQFAYDHAGTVYDISDYYGKPSPSAGT